LGKYSICEVIIPNLSIVSKRIESALKDDQSDPIDQVVSNEDAATKIRFILQEICVPYLEILHKPTDTVEDYVKKYGFLGDSLHHSVNINRITTQLKYVLNF